MLNQIRKQILKFIIEKSIVDFAQNEIHENLKYSINHYDDLINNQNIEQIDDYIFEYFDLICELDFEDENEINDYAELLKIDYNELSKYLSMINEE